MMSSVAPPPAGARGGLWHYYIGQRYAVLFFSLVLTLAAGPLLASIGFHGSWLDAVLAVNLLAAIVPAGQRVRTRALFGLLVACALVSRLATLWIGPGVTPALSLAAWSLLALLAAASALVFALRATAIDREHIYAALSAYLLAGVFFGLMYWALAQVNSGAFAAGGEFSRVSAIYFSFVTLATLGYGDIVPRDDLARSLAIIEGIGGQLFLAVFVARLVSLYARERS